MIASAAIADVRPVATEEQRVNGEGKVSGVPSVRAHRSNLTGFNPRPSQQSEEGGKKRRGKRRDQRYRLRLAISSRTAGTSSVGISISVWVLSSDAASSSATASSSVCSS